MAALLNKKDSAARDLRKQLTVLQQRSSQLQSELDESRLQVALETQSTLEEAMLKVGVPPRKGGRTFVP